MLPARYGKVSGTMREQTPRILLVSSREDMSLINIGIQETVMPVRDLSADRLVVQFDEAKVSAEPIFGESQFFQAEMLV